MSSVPTKKFFIQSASGRLLISQATGRPFAVTVQGSGVVWNVSSAESLPETAEYLDICLVPAGANATTIDTSDLTVVRLANNLVTNDGNIFPENSIMLFSKLNGDEGTSQISIDLDGQNLRVLDYPLAASVVNLGDMQQKVDVYIYNGNEWVLAPFVQLPLIFNATLSLSAWLGTGAELGEIPDLWEELGLSDNYEKAPNVEGGTAETLVLEAWLGKLTDFGTIDDLWAMLGLTESATQATNNGEPIPIT